MRKYAEYTLVAALLLPLLFLNIRSSHDWGDDFAQYIHQAQNISEGISQDETGYMFNPQAFLGPQAYPVGFPLLLTPFAASDHIDYKILNVYISLFLALSCLLGFLVLRRYFSFATALVTTLIIAYNPVSISFKSEILSDLPFMFFSMLVLFLAMQKEKLLYTMAIGLLLGFTCQIRSIALVLLLAIVLHRLLNMKRNGSFDRQGFVSLTLLLMSFIASWLFIRLLWPASSAYPQFFETGSPIDTMFNHLSSHNESLHKFFRDYEVRDYFFISCIAASCLTAFGLLGFCISLKRDGLSLFNLYVLGYILVIIIYKYADTGLRFVYPLLFLVFYYAVIGLKTGLVSFGRGLRFMPYVFGAFILYSYYRPVHDMHTHRDDVQEGPCTAQAQEVFEFIKHQLPPGSTIAFEKPRALALYTERQAMCPTENISGDALKKELASFHCDHILSASPLTAPARIQELQEDTAHYRSVFTNGVFTLYVIQRSHM